MQKYNQDRLVMTQHWQLGNVRSSNLTWIKQEKARQDANSTQKSSLLISPPLEQNRKINEKSWKCKSNVTKPDSSYISSFKFQFYIYNV